MAKIPGCFITKANFGNKEMLLSNIGNIYITDLEKGYVHSNAAFINENFRSL